MEAPKKREARNKMEDPHPKRQMNHLRGQTIEGEHQVLEPPLVVRSILNKERGEPPKKTLSRDKPSLTTIPCFKIQIVCALCNATDTLCL